MDKLEFLRQCQGTLSQTAFAEALGISQAHLSRIISGKRGPGRGVIAALLRLFPERHDEIMGLFLLSDDDNQHDSMSGGIETV